jgi:hypothetical protein
MMIFLILAFIIVAITLVFELFTGQILLWRGVWFTRDQYPTLYWIFIATKAVAVPICVYHLMYAISSNHP